MKHRIRYFVLFGLDALFIVLTLFTGYLCYPSFGRIAGRYQEGFELVIFLTMAIFLNHAFLGIHKIVFSESHITLSGFHFSSAGNKSFHEKSFIIKYENIYKITAIRIPIFGVIRISFCANHFRKKFSFSCLYSHHRKLFRELCTNVRQTNPDAMIDKKLSDYLKT